MTTASKGGSTNFVRRARYNLNKTTYEPKPLDVKEKLNQLIQKKQAITEGRAVPIKNNRRIKKLNRDAK